MIASNDVAVPRGRPSWERRLCLAFPCVLDEFHVRRTRGPNGEWIVAASPEAPPVLERSAVPQCPHCGGDLVPALAAPTWWCWRVD